MKKLLNSQDLTHAETYRLFSELSTMPIEQQCAILALLSVKGETMAELLGARQYFMEYATQIPSNLDILDIVGTGGDGKNTFNISTATSIVVASCGVKVAKHGGRSATSNVGSADVMENLQINLTTDPQKITHNLLENNYAYLCGQLFNTALKNFSKLRTNLGMPTIFNKIATLLNPLSPKRVLLGINSKKQLHIFVEILKDLGFTRAMVVHSDDGLDEISISANTTVVELSQGTITEYQIHPHDAELSTAPLIDILATKDNTKIVQDLLNGNLTGPKLDIVLLNSAAALMVAERVQNLKEGVRLARAAIESGRTAALLSKLKR